MHLSIYTLRTVLVSSAFASLITLVAPHPLSRLAGPQVSVGGTYATAVTLVTNECTGTVVRDNPTTVVQQPGDTLMTLTHGPIRATGSVRDDGLFRMVPSTLSMSGVHYEFAIDGRFVVSGFHAMVQVTRDSAGADHCEYTVRWIGTKTGTPNVIPRSH